MGKMFFTPRCKLITLAVLAGLSSSTTYATCTQTGDVFTCTGSGGNENIHYENAVVNVDANFLAVGGNYAFDLRSDNDLTFIQQEGGKELNGQTKAIQVLNLNSSVNAGKLAMTITGKIRGLDGLFVHWQGIRDTISIHTKGDIVVDTSGIGIDVLSLTHANAKLLSIITEGKITAGDGIAVEGSNIYIEAKGDIDTTAGTNGFGNGIDVHAEYGDVTVKTSGKIDALNSAVHIYQDGGNTNLIVENDVTSLDDAGIDLWRVNNTGVNGNSQIHVLGNVNSVNGSAIHINTRGDDGDLTMDVEGDISGEFGIRLNTLGATNTGNTYISTSGSVTGNYYSAINLSQTDRAELALHVKSGTVQGVGTVVSLYNADSTGDTTLTVDNGAVISGFSMITHDDASQNTSVLVDIAGQVTGTSSGDVIFIDGTMDNATLALRHGWDVSGSVKTIAQANKAILKLHGDENGSLDLLQLGDDTHANGILGFNHFEKAGNSVWTLTGNNQVIGATFQGLFDTAVINEGGVLLDGATFAMSGSDALTVESAGSLYGNGAAIVEGNVANSGMISLSQPMTRALSRAVGTTDTLTINGDYVGNNGQLVLDTALGGDGSATDKLVINGQASGTTFVAINNAGGTGAQTIDGIEIITTQGSTDNAFARAGRIVAGSYEYDVMKAGTNWHLTSKFNPNTNEDTLRPEIGAYAANLAAANTMFVSRLHNRLGETQYTDYFTGESKVTSMWLRQEGGHTRSKNTSGQLKTQGNRYVVQIGGDFAQWSSNNLDRFHLGAMVGYGYYHGNTRSDYTGYDAKSRTDGYAVGLYGTWYANKADKSGLYIDSWVQYAWFDNTVKGDGLTEENYDSKGWLASVEAGYSFKMGENDRVSYWIQPKAQVTWMAVHADKHTEANGTQVWGHGDNISTRLGLRAYLQGHSEIDDETGRTFQPFVEANWLYNSQAFGVSMNGVSDYQAGTRNMGEVKVGIEAHLNNNVNMWGSIGQQVGGKGYSDTQATVGVKFSF